MSDVCDQYNIMDHRQNPIDAPFKCSSVFSQYQHEYMMDLHKFLL